MPERYVRQPIVVEAMQVNVENVKELAEWCEAIQTVTIRVGEPAVLISFKGPKPMMAAPVGSYIVKEPNGEFRLYPRGVFQHLHLPEKHWDTDIWPSYDH